MQANGGTAAEARHRRHPRLRHPHRQPRLAGARPSASSQSTGGWCEQVTEQEIALAKAEIGAEGIGCEPASAVTLAGLKKLVAEGRVSREERVVLLLTGHTLKDSEYTIDYHRGELLTAAELAARHPRRARRSTQPSASRPSSSKPTPTPSSAPSKPHAHRRSSSPSWPQLTAS